MNRIEGRSGWLSELEERLQQDERRRVRNDNIVFVAYVVGLGALLTFVCLYWDEFWTVVLR